MCLVLFHPQNFLSLNHRQTVQVADVQPLGRRGGGEWKSAGVGGTGEGEQGAGAGREGGGRRGTEEGTKGALAGSFLVPSCFAADGFLPANPGWSPLTHASTCRNECDDD